MSSPETNYPVHHQVVLDRFVTACKTDQRIVAAFLGGSYARGEADSYSDFDLYVITTDEDFQELPRLRPEIVDGVGEPLYLAMLHSGLSILRFYQELARPLADAYGIKSPDALERLMVQRLEKLEIFS